LQAQISLGFCVTVQVWVGEIPEHSQEREAIVALARGLARLEQLYLILASFTVGGQAVDLAIFKPNAGFVIELKHCDGRVIGGVNGRWRVVDANEEVHIINPGRRNPYNQVISYFYRLSNFLNQHRGDFLSAHRASSVDFRTCKRMVVISPSVHPESEIKLDWKVDLKGLDELPTYLVTATSSEIDLTEDELLSIPRLLRCEPWHDVNLLIGEEDLVEESWPTPEEAAKVAGTEAVAVEEVEEEEAEEETVPVPLWQRWVRGVSIGLIVLALIALAGFWTGAWSAFWGRFHPTPTPTVTPTTTMISIPDPTVAPPLETPIIPCEYVEQSVVRESAFASGEVEVVLRSVCFASDQMTLQWMLVNNGSRPVRLPLVDSNISILDNIGNEYPVDDGLSEPRVLVARPGERVEGNCTVPRSISPDAITLRIYINGEPFEEQHVWFSNIPGRE
jgi:hypothetical protein